VEGDEYDTAFFDKTPKFLHYRARTLILTSVEFDHADIYRDLDHVKEAFRELVSSMPADGTILAATLHPGVRDVLASASCAVLGYGVAAEGLDWGVAGLESDDRGTHFDVLQDGRAVARAFVPLFGSFNVENSLGALATAATLGVPIEEAVDALSTFRGVKRRQELRGEQRGVAVIDDFAHHPTAVRGSIEAVRERFAGRRIIAVFEPRTNTSRRAIFQNDYARALEAADAVYVQAAAERPMYSATGPVTEFFSAQKLVEDIARRGVSAHCLDSVQEIVDQLAGECESGDVVLCMSNGAFEDIWRRLLDALRT
jgi:UDP-N-acetylmuramate: L-alanyl-gamma-D-glutamyl-meso-diaminopimelate ligase